VEEKLVLLPEFKPGTDEPAGFTKTFGVKQI
jgi:hypothetical protein